MTFKTWLTDLTKIQGVVNNIKNVSAVVDGATGLLNQNVVNSLSAAINGLSLQQAQLALSTKNLTKEQMNQILVQAGLIASENQIQAELVQSALAQAGLSAEKQKAILQELGLMNATTLELFTTKSCTKEKLLNMLATKGVTGANAEAIISTLGLADTQTVTVGTTNKLSLAMKQLSLNVKGTIASMKAFIIANPAITFTAITTALVAGSVSLINYVQKWATGTEAIKKYDKALEESKKKVEENTNSISEHNSKIEENNAKIEELQALYADGTITEAQKAEIENLKYQNALLDEKIKTLQQVNDEETKNQAKTSVNKFNTEFGGNAEGQYKQFTYDTRNNYGDTNETLMLDSMENTTASKQLMTLKYFTDAYNQAVKNLNDGVEGITQEDVDYYREALDEAKNVFSSVHEGLWNDLQSQKTSLEAVRGTDAFDEDTYKSIISWENVFKDYVDVYKNAAEKVQENSDQNPIKISYKSDVEALNKSLKSLTENASLLSSVNSEIAETGRISADSLSKINDAFPEEKYPEMTKALLQYQLRLIDNTQLLETLQKTYEQEAEAYKLSVANKISYDENFYDTLVDNNKEYFKELDGKYKEDSQNLADKYKEDFTEFKNFETAKQKLILLTEASLGGFASDYIGYHIDPTTGLMSVVYKATADMDMSLTAEQDEELTRAWNKAKKLAEDYNKLIQISYKQTPDIKIPSSDTGSKKEIGPDDTKQAFNNSLALYKYQLAMNQITEAKYYDELDKLNQQYFANKEEYLSEYRQYEEEVYQGLLSLQKNSLDAIHNLVNLRVDMIKDMNQEAIDAHEKEIEAEKEKLNIINKQIDARRKSLELLKDEKDHEAEMAERNKAVSDLQFQLDALKYDDTAAAQKKRRQLEAELAEKQKDLADYISDYEYDKAMEALNEEAKAAEEKYNKEEERLQNEIENIQEYLDDEKALQQQAVTDINGMNNSLFENMKQWAYETTGEVWEVVDAWKKAKEALEQYNAVDRVPQIHEMLHDSSQNNTVLSAADLAAMDTASATIDSNASGYMADQPLPADLTPQLMEWSKAAPDFFAQYLQPDISTLPQIQTIEPVFTFNGDIIINGDMGSLTKNDLNEFRKDIIHDMYETMQKNRVKSGTC